VLTIGDLNYIQNDIFASAVFTTTPAAGSVYQIESSTITVDTAWDTQPDNTSRFVIQSGGVYMLSGATTTPFYTLQYYDVLHDMWYSRSATTLMMTAQPADCSLERVTENTTIWQQGIASSGSTTTLVDNTVNWTANAYTGYQTFIFSGTGRGQIANITQNTSTTLTFNAQSTAIDSTSRYQILGYDGGKSSGSNAYNTIIDSSKSWPVNRYANYGVRILYGTGAGQQRQILSNTTTTLTIYGNWNILPDNTSVYSIQGYSETMYLGWAAVTPSGSEIFMHNIRDNDLLTHGRVYETGIACVAAALLCDANHVVYEQPPIAITSLSGTTTITATTAQAHNLKVGQYVSIRGVTSAAADQYNVAGLYQITTVSATNSFTYTPQSAGSGTYAYLTALSTSNLSDASKDYRDTVSSATNTTITFNRNTPSNINGWYASGTNVTPGAYILSGGGTTTVTLSSGSATPSGVIVFTPWGPTTAISSTYSSGGGANVANVTMTASTSSLINGWYAVGTGIAIGATVTGGAGSTTLNFSAPCTAAVSGAITFYPPNVSGRLVTMNTAAPAVTTGLQAGQNMLGNTSGVAGATMGFITALGTAPTAAITRYAICDTKLLGAALDQTLTTYNSGVVTSSGTTTITDTAAVWAISSVTGSAQSATITLSGAAPGNINGWYVTGTGVNPGTYVVSGQGTTTLTLSTALNASTSGTYTFNAWNQSLVNRKIKIQSGATGSPQELVISAISGATITFSAATQPIAGVAVYSLLSLPTRGTGHETQLATGNSNINNRGKYLWASRGGGVVGIDRLDITTDRAILSYLTPFAETLSTGSMFAYDGQDRLYFTKDLTQRVYYLDLNTNIVHGAGFYPYAAPTTGIGNKMEIFTTVDGLKYMWLNRQQNQEHFRQLIFY
jgi:hypothetical protein